MFQALKSIFQKGGSLPRVEVLEYGDGLLSFKSQAELPLSNVRVRARSQNGTVDTEIQILSYDVHTEVYRASVNHNDSKLEVLGVDRRIAVRLPLILKVISAEIKGFTCNTEDLSATGARILTDHRMEVGKVLALTVDLDDPSLPPLRVKGEVRWSSQRSDGKFHSGFRFVGLDRLQEKTIQHYIAARLRRLERHSA